MVVAVVCIRFHHFLAFLSSPCSPYNTDKQIIFFLFRSEIRKQARSFSTLRTGEVFQTTRIKVQGQFDCLAICWWGRRLSGLSQKSDPHIGLSQVYDPEIKTIKVKVKVWSLVFNQGSQHHINTCAELWSRISTHSTPRTADSHPGRFILWTVTTIASW